MAGRASPRERPASSVARRLAILRAADDLLPAAALGVRAPNEPASRIAFAAAVDTTIGSLLRSSCTESALEATRTPRGKATALLWTRQRELLVGAGLYDDRAIADSIDVSGIDSGLVLQGATDISMQLLELLLRVHQTSRGHGGRGVTIALPRLSAVPDPISPIASLIEKRFAEEDDAPEIEWVEPPINGSIDVIEAANPDAEARAATATIVRALDAGTSIDRIAIAVPSESEALLESLRANLDEAGVPFSEAGGRAASVAPEVRALLALVTMAASRIERDKVIEILRTPGLHAGSWVDVRSEAEAERRAAVLAHRLRELPLSADRDGALFVETARSLIRSEDEAWMGEALARLVAVVTSLRSVTTRSGFAKMLGDTAHRLRLGEPSATELETLLRNEAAGGARLALEAVGEGAVASRAAMEALREIADAAARFDMDRAPLGLDELLAELRLELDRSSTAARGGSARAAAVRIASPRELAGIEHDLVVVMGLRARAYGGEGASDPWLDERTIAALPASVRPRSVGLRRAAHSAELAWAMAWSKQTILTRSATDEEGREAEPAHEIFSQAIRSGSQRREEPASRVSPRASTPSARSAELTLLAMGEPPAPELWARVGIEKDRRSFFLDPRRSAGAFTGRVPDRSLSALIERVGGSRPDKSIGVSAIERAAGCAFRSFAERVLGARRIEDAMETASARDRGVLLHKALHTAFDVRRELGPSATPEDILAESERAIRVALDLTSPMSSLQSEARGLVVRDALLVLADEIDHPEPLVYFAGEQRFGRGEPAPYGPLEIVSSRGTRIFVDGQIDRIDRSTDGSKLQVIDYKTGKAPTRKALGETVFQLPLYAAAAKRFYGGGDASGIYVSVKAGGGVDRSPKKASDAAFDDADLARIASSAANVVERMWMGDVAPRPAHPKQCARCDARDICRRPAVIPKGDSSGADDLDTPPVSVPPKSSQTEQTEPET